MRGCSIRTKASLVFYDNDHVAWQEIATITLVDYCDFEYPYCRRAHPVITRLQDSLKDELRFVFRNFPLMHKHPLAQQSFETAEAAGAQGQFCAMYDLLLEYQQTRIMRFSQSRVA